MPSTGIWRWEGMGQVWSPEAGSSTAKTPSPSQKRTPFSSPEMIFMAFLNIQPLVPEVPSNHRASNVASRIQCDNFAFTFLFKSRTEVTVRDHFTNKTLVGRWQVYKIILQDSHYRKDIQTEHASDYSLGYSFPPLVPLHKSCLKGRNAVWDIGDVRKMMPKLQCSGSIQGTLN